MDRRLALLMVLVAAGCLVDPPRISHSALAAPHLIAALDTVFLEEMTWMEVRDAVRGGKTTVLVPTGGIEENGPYLATGKHNVILRAAMETVARQLGNALVAPIVPFVPEGNIDPPTGHMKYPGTISVTEDTYERLLTDVCASLRMSEFRNIVLLGDSSGNQQGMQNVARHLTAKWARHGVRVHFISQYYNYAEVERWLEEQGIRLKCEDVHDDFIVTAQLMAVNPTAVRLQERLAGGQFRISGLMVSPEQAVLWGKKIIAFRAERTVRAIRQAIQR